MKPAFLITIDTEGDDVWTRTREPVTTRNAFFLPRFQTQCERFGFKPTYLVNHEMATSPAFVSFARERLRANQAEIGMHLHAWNSPPDWRLTSDDREHHPYLIEYPEEVVRAKVSFMTSLLSDTFDARIVSHRAGRWAFDDKYACALVDLGYLVDCSVTPHVSWQAAKGAPNGAGGIDYREFPERPYFVDVADISRAGISPLLEVPMTIRDLAPRVARPLLADRTTLFARALRRLWPVNWLRPNGSNLSRMLQLVDGATAAGDPCIELMLHSSELMPGGSPYFPSEMHIERLYADLNRLFERISVHYSGLTLAEFHSAWLSKTLRANRSV